MDSSSIMYIFTYSTTSLIFFHVVLSNKQVVGFTIVFILSYPHLFASKSMEEDDT